MSRPRIIAGIAKGHRLISIPGKAVRPITDRAKKALFDIIGNDIQNATLLDLFGGTGSVGIEALSRGADFVRFVDNNRAAIATIKANLVRTQLQNQSEVLQLDAFTLLRLPTDRSFNYIFIAPPQYKNLWKHALAELDINPGWLTIDAWVIVQIHPREYQATILKNLQEFDQRKYGSTLLVFYELITDSAT